MGHPASYFCWAKPSPKLIEQGPCCWRSDRWAVVAQSRLPGMPLQQCKVPWRTRRDDFLWQPRVPGYLSLGLKGAKAPKKNIKISYWLGGVHGKTLECFVDNQPMGEGWWSSSQSDRSDPNRTEKSAGRDNHFGPSKCKKELWILFHVFTVFIYFILFFFLGGGAEIPLSSRNVGYEDYVRYYYNSINMYVYV